MDTYLLIKYFKCATNSKEESQIRSWLADDPDGSHEKAYKDAHIIFEGMTLYANREDARMSNVTKLSAKKRRYRVFSSVAAVLALVFAVGYGVRETVLSDISKQMTVLSVPAGKNMDIILADGTKIWLNSGAEIEYPAVFSRKARRVKVNEGEVLFDVRKENDGRPFMVETYASNISVLGTKFNVWVDEQSQEFHTTLLEGKIEIVSKSGADRFEMKPNDMVKLNKDRLYKTKVKNPELVYSWVDGLINISGVPFKELMRRFELAYNVNIVIDRETLPEIRYTRGQIRVSEGLDHALAVLALASSFEYYKDLETNTIYIR